MPNVRQASAGDLAAVRQLLHDTWHATYDASMGAEAVEDITARWHSMEVLGRQLDDANGCFLVAEDLDGTIVGHAAASRGPGDVVNLSRLYVLPDLQGRGAGSALLQAVMDWAGPGTSIELEVEAVNAPAIGFYRRHGFSDDGRKLQCGGDPVAGQALVMKRSLS